MNTKQINFPVLSSLFLTLILSGCLGGGSEDSSAVGGPPPPPPPTTNTPPVISGSPSGAVSVGDQYMFAPNASDSDGDTLTFSVSNQPDWSSFDSNSGRLSGIPELGNIGIYPNIVISVSDGEAQTSLGGFTIDVTQIGTGSTTLIWTAPTHNEDGTLLTDLAGYRIYYGQSSGTYGPPIEISNLSVLTYVVDGLVPNTYYFAATAFNTSGIESGFSGELVRVVNSN